MRRIGEIDEGSEAQRFVDFLLTLGIDARLRGESSDPAQIWIVDDTDLDRARRELDAFRAEPAASRYRDAEKSAKSIRTEERKRQEKSRHREVRFRDRFERPAFHRTPVSIGLILICSALFLLTDYGNPIQNKFGEIYVVPVYETLGFIDYIQDEWWRRLTTQLFHGGIIHFLFCMMVLYRHLPMLEGRFGSAVTAALCVLFAAGAAFGQWLPYGIEEMSGDLPVDFVVERPYVGMSGVLYGIVGLIWVLGRRAPRFGLALSDSSLYFYGVWFVLCFFSDQIANGGHAGGLVTGVLVALILARFVQRGSRHG